MRSKRKSGPTQSRYGSVLPVQVDAWKEELQGSMADVFRSGAKEPERAERLRAR